MKIQTKIILTTTLALLAFISISTVVNIIKMYDVVDQRVENIEIPAALGDLKGNILNTLSIPITISKGMVDNEYIHDWLSGGEQPSGQKRLVDYLDKIKVRNDASAIFLVSKGSSNFYFESGVMKTLSPESEKDNWLLQFYKVR